MFQHIPVFLISWLGVFSLMWGQAERPVRTIHEQWDAQLGEWVAEWVSHFEYHASGALIATRREVWDAEKAAWLPGMAWQRTYDEAGQLIRHRSQWPVDQQAHPWAPALSAHWCYQEYARDEQGRIRYLRTRVPEGPRGQLITTDSQAYHYDPAVGAEPAWVAHYTREAGQGMTWRETVHHTYIYDQQGRLVYQRDEAQRPQQAQWVRLTEYYYSYDAALHQTRAITVQHEPPYTSTQERLTYDAEGQLTHEWQAIREGPGSPWQPVWEKTYHYSPAGERIGQVVQSQWLAEAQGWTQRYEQAIRRRPDGQPLQVTERHFRQNPTTPDVSYTLTSQVEATYAYDAWGRPTSYVRRQVMGGQQRRNQRLRHVYADPDPDRLGLRVYPNPAQQHIYVLWPQMGQATGLLRVRDLTGRQLWQQPARLDAHQPYRLPLADWEAGAYLLEFQQGDQQFYATFMKQ